MTLTFAGTLDRSALTATVDQLTDLVGSPAVADAWDRESALAGMTVGGLARHLVSQPECAVEFLSTPGPPDAQLLTLVGHYERVDWLHAPVDAPQNTSIRDDFNQMGSAGRTESVEVLAQSREQLGAAIDAAGLTTYVPWQDCALPTDDFLVVRLMEIVVHADELACSVGLAPGVQPRGARARARPSRGAGREAARSRRSAAHPEPTRALSRFHLGILTAAWQSQNWTSNVLPTELKWPTPDAPARTSLRRLAARAVQRWRKH